MSGFPVFTSARMESHKAPNSIEYSQVFKLDSWTDTKFSKTRLMSLAHVKRHLTLKLLIRFSDKDIRANMIHFQCSPGRSWIQGLQGKVGEGNQGIDR